ncbi:MAG: SufD family Fe-S cluster assembly protein [Candidatus Nitrosocaldaceae archaeon]
MKVFLSSLDKDRLDLEPKWLKDSRKRSLEYYNLLPNEVSSLYNKYTSITSLNSDAIFFDIDKKQPSQYILKHFNEMENSVLSVNNSINIKIDKELEEKGVIIKNIINALEDDKGLIREIIEKIDPLEDRFLALENALFNSGIFIYIPPNLVIEKPITLIHEMIDSSNVIRNLFYIDRSSSATIIQEIYSNTEEQALFELNQSYLSNNSSLNHVVLQSMNNRSVHIANYKSYIMRDANLNSYLGAFGGFISRYKIDNILEEEGANVEHMENVLGNNEQIFDITANLIHNSHNTRGKAISKNIVRDKSKSLFKGMIKISKEARNSESYLAGHAIIMNKGAKADSIPSLEIENNEVKATHSASVSQINEEEIFYLQARGFSREEAERFIIMGFVEPLLRRLTSEARIWTTYLIEKKWYNMPLIINNEEVQKFVEIEKESKRIEKDIFEKHYKYR